MGGRLGQFRWPRPAFLMLFLSVSLHVFSQGHSAQAVRIRAAAGEAPRAPFAAGVRADRRSVAHGRGRVPEAALEHARAGRTHQRSLRRHRTHAHTLSRSKHSFQPHVRALQAGRRHGHHVGARRVSARSDRKRSKGCGLHSSTVLLRCASVLQLDLMLLSLSLFLLFSAAPSVSAPV